MENGTKPKLPIAQNDKNIYLDIFITTKTKIC
jgi:hypothetical protein